MTIEAADKIQKSMELMLKNNEIKWQGTLRKTFNKYFHPEVIDRESKEIFDTLGSGEVPDLFQFSTQLGQSMIKKIKPSSVIEATAISSIIRLMTDDGGEQPVDTFMRFKNDLSLWYKEMRDFGLNEDEIKVFEKHLKHLKGVADSQESIMLMAMDEKIAKFDLKIATKLRKLVSKKKKDEALLFKPTLYEWVENAGNRKEVADYLWHQIKRMLLYSFSVPHSLAYTLIGIQELNIFHHYNKLFWQTACLTVNSGSQEVEEDEKAKDTNYGKVAEAIGKLKSYNVSVALPSINKSEFEFIPDIENDRILYSLKGIVGVNDDLVKAIIDNRPYNSFDDFYNKMCVNYPIGEDAEGNTVYGSLIGKSKMLTLIKAGCFDEFDERLAIMREYIKKLVDVKTTLDMKNIKSVIRLGLLNGENEYYLKLLKLKDHLSSNVIEVINKPKDRILGMTEKAYDFYMEVFTESSQIDFNGQFYTISEKVFKKQLDKELIGLKELLKSEDFVRSYNNAQFFEIWSDLAKGSIEKWEMESVSYYSDKHELDSVNYDLYNISNYFELSEQPEIIGFSKFKDRQYPKYETHTLIGTVLDRNKNKHIVTLLTPEGVVSCKMHGGAFSHYDKTISKQVGSKKETVEKSWFTRGNLIMVKGFRREDQFVLKTYAQKGKQKDHTIQLITDVLEDGQIKIKSERSFS